MSDPRSEYYNGFLDAMFAVKDLVNEWLSVDNGLDVDSFLFEFWALQEEISGERGPES